MTRNFSFFS